jgi:hypothetical protein
MDVEPTFDFGLCFDGSHIIDIVFAAPDFMLPDFLMKYLPIRTEHPEHPMHAKFTDDLKALTARWLVCDDHPFRDRVQLLDYCLECKAISPDWVTILWTRLEDGLGVPTNLGSLLRLCSEARGPHICSRLLEIAVMVHAVTSDVSMMRTMTIVDNIVELATTPLNTQKFAIQLDFLIGIACDLLKSDPAAKEHRDWLYSAIRRAWSTEYYGQLHDRERQVRVSRKWFYTRDIIKKHFDRGVATPAWDSPKAFLALSLWGSNHATIADLALQVRNTVSDKDFRSFAVAPFDDCPTTPAILKERRKRALYVTAAANLFADILTTPAGAETLRSRMVVDREATKLRVMATLTTGWSLPNK